MEHFLMSFLGVLYIVLMLEKARVQCFKLCANWSWNKEYMCAFEASYSENNNEFKMVFGHLKLKGIQKYFCHKLSLNPSYLFQTKDTFQIWEHDEMTWLVVEFKIHSEFWIHLLDFKLSTFPQHGVRVFLDFPYFGLRWHSTAGGGYSLSERSYCWGHRIYTLIVFPTVKLIPFFPKA